MTVRPCPADVGRVQHVEAVGGTQGGTSRHPSHTYGTTAPSMAVPRTPRDEDGFVLVKADDGSAPLPDHVAQLADSMQRVDLNGTSPTESDAQTRTADAHPSRPCLPCTTHQRVPVIDRPARLGVEKLTHAPLNLRVFPESPLSLDEFEFVTGDPGSLGTGAMGSVLLARWKTRPGQPWRAIKKVSKFQIWKDDDPVMLFEQLWDEVEALMTLRHPHIVQIDGYVEDYKYIYLIMEYAPKGDLNQALSDKSRFDDSTILVASAIPVRSCLMCAPWCCRRGGKAC